MMRNTSNRCLEPDNRLSYPEDDELAQPSQMRMNSFDAHRREMDDLSSSKPRLAFSPSNRQLSSSKALLRQNSSRKNLAHSSSRHRLRRKSVSYPDMFEGEIAGSIFMKQTSVMNTAATNLTPGEEDGEGLQLAIDQQQQQQQPQRKLSQKLFSTWFFTNPKRGGQDADRPSEGGGQDADRPSGSGNNGSGEDKERSTSSLTAVISKKFSAAKDFRHLNFSMPQSM